MKSIRRAKAADCNAIALIWNQIIRDTSATFTTDEKSPEAVLATLRSAEEAGHGVWVAEDAGAVLGFATYGQFRGGPGYRHSMEHSVHLAEAARGRGLGRQLLQVVEDHARDAGVHAMLAGISGENAAAIAFHAACGYREVARLPEVGRKFERWMDLVLMQKFL